MGTRGGTFTYTGGGTSTIQNKITGTGGFTFYSRHLAGERTKSSSWGIISAPAALKATANYQGPTNLWISLSTDQSQFGRIGWTRDNQIPATSAVTMNVVDDIPCDVR